MNLWFLNLNETGISLFVFAMLILTRTMFNTILNPYLARLLPNEYMGIGFGIRDVFLSLGCAAGLFITGFLTENLIGFLIYITLIFLILLLLILKTNLRELTESSDEEGKEMNGLKSWKKMPVKLKLNFGIIIIIGCLIACGLEVHDYSAMIGADFGVKAQNIYHLYSSSVLITALFSIVGGVLIDKFQARTMYFCYVGICFLSCAVLLFQNVYVYALSLILLGVKGVLDNVEQTYFFKMYKEYQMEKLYSANSIIQMILPLAVPVLFGCIYDISFSLMILVGAGSLGLALLFCLGIAKE